MSPRRRLAFALLPALLVLVACSGERHCVDAGGHWDAATKTCARDAGQAVPAQTPTPAPAVAQIPMAGTDAARTAHYRYAINYPDLGPDRTVLVEALHRYGDKQKADFLDLFRDPDSTPESAAYPWQLTLDFTLAGNGKDFVSVLASGDSFTGGAHGNPLLASFTLHVQDNRLVTLGDLFAEPAAGLKALSRVARQSLLARLKQRLANAGPDAAPALKQQAANNHKWIEDGTAPTAENYAVFVVESGADGRATGIKLLFPPYQVGPYADGTQEEDVPASAFVKLLKPEFRAAFAAGNAK